MANPKCWGGDRKGKWWSCCQGRLLEEVVHKVHQDLSKVGSRKSMQQAEVVKGGDLRLLLSLDLVFLLQLCLSLRHTCEQRPW
jgi:hypothetical protein